MDWLKLLKLNPEEWEYIKVKEEDLKDRIREIYLLTRNKNINEQKIVDMFNSGKAKMVLLERITTKNQPSVITEHVLVKETLDNWKKHNDKNSEVLRTLINFGIFLILITISFFFTNNFLITSSFFIDIRQNTKAFNFLTIFIFLLILFAVGYIFVNYINHIKKIKA